MRIDRNTFAILIAPLLISACGDKIESPQQALDACIEYHDPESQQSSFAATMLALHSNKDEWSTDTLVINNLKGTFKLSNVEGDAFIQRISDSRATQVLINDTLTPVLDWVSVEKKLGIWKLDPTWHHKFYQFLLGIPSKFKDEQAILEPELGSAQFNKKDSWELTIKYEGKTDTPVWLVYIDKESNALLGYKFFFNTERSEGEMVEINSYGKYKNMTLPGSWQWYYLKGDNVDKLGVDSIAQIKSLY